MKVLQVVGDSKFGGATYLILEWCKFLLARGCEVHVLSTDKETIAELKRIRGVSVVQSIYIPRNIAPAADTLALVQLVRLIRNRRYHVVHTHTSTPGVIGRAAAWIARAPVRLHTAHGWPVCEFSGLAERVLYPPLENAAARMSTRVICVSDAALSQGRRFRLAPAKKLVVVRNGIDPVAFSKNYEGAGRRLREELGLPPDCLLIGSTSRLAKQKDLESLVRSVPFLRKLLFGRKLVVLLAGDGPERAALEALAVKLRVNHYIRFLGFRRDIPQFLAALDVFVNTSLWEGLSISLLEAMAAERPIVTTDIEANAELIEDAATGFLVGVQAPEEIAVAIAQFARDKRLATRCAKAARRRLLAEFTLDRMFQDQWELYEDLRNKRIGYARPRAREAAVASEPVQANTAAGFRGSRSASD
jgi:glycosyltransferase involved in cell wall biosynthesis